MLRHACGGSVRALMRSNPDAMLTAGMLYAPGVLQSIGRATITIESSRAPKLGVAQLLQAYKELSKAKLSAFVVSTACAGFALGSGDDIDWEKMAWTAVGTFGASAAANTLNQVYEVEQDRLMKRTQRRPLPSGLLTRRHALAFAGVSAAVGLGCLYMQTNSTTTLLGAANIGLYACIYTPLKQVSVVNTWVGALVGAVPPLMGWAAAAGYLEPGAGVLAALLYFWQLPHFMALAYMYRADYAAGGYRMLPLIDATGRRVGGVALRNALYLLPLGPLACAMGVCTPPFALETAALSGALALGAALFRGAPTQGSARRLFLLSLVHLPVLQAMAVIHRVPNTAEARAFAAEDTLAAYAERHREVFAADSSPSLPEAMAGALGQEGSYVVPFPFLPLPRIPPVACPSRIECAGGDGGAEQPPRPGAAAAA